MISNGHPPTNAAPDGVRILPMAIPDWDTSKAADSFRAFAHFVHGQAKGILLRDGNHSEMLFFMPSDGKGELALWGNPNRDLQAQWIRRHITENYSYGVIHVVEAWAHFAPTPGDHTLKQVIAGEIRVSELRPEDRTEVLMVSAQSRDGWAISWTDQINRDAAGKLSLGGCQEIKDFEGRFGKLFG